MAKMTTTYGIFGVPGSGCNFIITLIKFYMLSGENRDKFVSEIKVSDVGDSHNHYDLYRVGSNVIHSHLFPKESVNEKEYEVMLAAERADVKILISYDMNDWVKMMCMASKKNFGRDCLEHMTYTHQVLQWLNRPNELKLKIDHEVTFKTIMGLTDSNINAQVATIMNSAPDNAIMPFVKQYQKINQEIYFENSFT